MIPVVVVGIGAAAVGFGGYMLGKAVAAEKLKKQFQGVCDSLAQGITNEVKASKDADPELARRIDEAVEKAEKKG